jgi:hypothetical protein
MFYIVQKNIFKEVHFNLLIDSLQKLGLDYEVVRFIPFAHEVEFVTQRKDIWVWGAYDITYTASKYGWKPGSMFNRNHNFEVYAPKFGMENMLNGDGTVIDFTGELPPDMPYLFARPTLDTKSFTAEVYSRESWEAYVKVCISSEVSDQLTAETRVLVAPPKHIQQEVRCWVVGGKVVTTSRYKMGSRVSMENYDDETRFTEFAQRMVDKFQVAEAFVLDVCEADDELKVVEVNCINCAGFYRADMYKLTMALEKHFS